MNRIDRRSFLSAAGLGLGLLVEGRFRAALADDAAARKVPPPANSSTDSAIVAKRGYTDCRFGQLHYIRAVPASGQATKPTLILLHQNPFSSVEYEPLLEVMATDREVVAFDTPGSGMSDWPPEPPDMAGYAAAFADGMDGLSLGTNEPVDVFGYHTGTLLGAELAIAEPDKVGRLVLSGVPFRTPEERQDRLDAIAAGPKLTEDGEQIFATWRKLWETVVIKRDPGVSLQRAARIFVERAKPMDRYWWPYIGVWSYDVKARFPLITQPVMILQPHEPLLEYSKRSADYIKDARIVELPQLDRDIFDVGSETIARELRAFLT